MDGYQRGRARRDIRIILGIYNPLSHALRDVVAEDVDLQLQNAVELVAMKHTAPWRWRDEVELRESNSCSLSNCLVYPFVQESAAQRVGVPTS